MPMAGSNPTSQNGSGGSSNSNPGAGAVVTNNSTAVVAVGLARTWELSDYGLHQTPQEAITDGTKIAVSPRALHSELMCPICLDVLQETMTTMECLHRFCSECINKALRSGNKECPTCRKKLVSRRSLRPDPNFDMLISKIYPSREEYEAQQQEAMARLSMSHNQLGLTTSIEERMKVQCQMRKMLKPGGKYGGNAQNAHAASVNSAEGFNITNVGNMASPGVYFGNSKYGMQNSVLPTTNSNSGQPAGGGNNGFPVLGQSPGANLGNISRVDSISGNGSSISSGFSDEITEVELVFKPHPDMFTQGTAIPSAQMQTRFLKTSPNASVEHLTKYLGMRLALDSQTDTTSDTLHHCTIYVSVNGTNFVTIPVPQTLSYVCEKYWKGDEPLEMFYSWKKI